MKNIEKILNIISSCTCGRTVKSILEKLEDKTNKTTVYRNLDKLLDAGEIIEDFTVSGEKIYSKKENHHHHFICDNCKETVNIGCFLNNEIDNLEKSMGFTVKNHSFVLNGICENCK